jgi:hypothetical protein
VPGRTLALGRHGVGVYTSALRLRGVSHDGAHFAGVSMELFIEFVGARWYLFTLVILLMFLLMNHERVGVARAFPRRN